MTWSEIITAIKDIFLAFAGVITAIVAVRGLNRWRLELDGKAKFEAARNLIRATYRLRDELKRCREPFISGSEFPDNYSPIDASPQERAKAYAHVYQNRWEPVSNGIQEFDTHTLEAEALWGKEARTRTDLLRQCVEELNTAIRTKVSLEMSDNRSVDRELLREINSKVTTLSGKQNELSKKIEAAVYQIEEFIRPHLSRD